MVEHGNVVRLVKNSNYIDLTAGDRLLLTGSFTFDITSFEIWAPLLNGLGLYLADKDMILNAEELGKFIAANRISILHLIPQLFNQISVRQPSIFGLLK
jgi:non-ribosomal peptide synthetase component F